MSERNDGGSAFPHEEWCNSATSRIEMGSPGMSLRDWFAGQALIGIIASPHQHLADMRTWARDAFCAADAMLAARAKTGGET